MPHNDRYRVFGIRHHGPGSARRLLASLEDWQPDLLLIEGPADAQSIVGKLNNVEMEPPVALVLYNDKDIDQASFLPFAEFSPEYQAICWAGRRQVPLELIDLPARHYLAHRAEEQLQLFRPAPTADPDQLIAERLRRDPLSLAAELAGYSDSERWWDATLERAEGDQDTFLQLLELITELRNSYPAAVDEETHRREAHMRLALRKALKSDYKRIAVIVGAWHGPALANLAAYPVKADRARLKGLPKIKVAAAWVPWSYPRLARESGYGAGVQSPAWYRLLFKHPEKATEHWMVAAAQLLREQDFDASPAQAADGVQLARSLASMREQELPGLAELQQAALSTLAAGAQERLHLIREKLSLGERVGKVPEGVSTVPLLADLQKELKATRMKKLWEVTGQHYLRATKTQARGGLDLRKSNHLRISHLLHRLNLLKIEWGQLQPLGPNSLGSFKEIWLMEWQPEFNLRLLERSSYGNTIAQAASRFSLEAAQEVNSVARLAQFILQALQADLVTIVPKLLHRLRLRATQTRDINALLQALPTLVNTSRYGDSRKTDTSALLLLIDELLPRITAGLSAAASQIDDDQAEDLSQSLSQANYALAQLEQEELLQLWQDGLMRLAQNPASHPLPRGLAWRLLFDQKRFNLLTTEKELYRALSPANGAKDVAHWVAGFLRSSGQLLLHYEPLRQLINQWVASLSWEVFEESLPLLRRTFAGFSPQERRSLFSLLEQPSAPSESTFSKEKVSVQLLADQEQLLLSLYDWMGKEG
ncbi:MAG: DUF5682 family protein [Bacteroidota bacterium]